MQLSTITYQFVADHLNSISIGILYESVRSDTASTIYTGKE